MLQPQKNLPKPITQNTETRRSAHAVPYQNFVIVSFSLMLVATAVTAIQYKVPTIMEPIMTQFSITAETAAWLMSIFTLLGVVVAIPIGLIARRFNPRNLILLAVAIACLASIVGVFAPHISMLMVSRALEGIALVIVVACGPLVLQRNVDPKKMGTATGIWMLGGMFGATLAGVTTPLVYNSLGFAGLWIAYAVFAAVSGVVFLLTVKPRDLLSSVENETQTAGINKSDYRVFAKVNTWLFLVPFALFQVLLLAVLSFAPTAMQQQGMDATLSGFASTLPMLLAIISSIAFGAISDKLQRRKPLYIIGLAFMGPCTFFMLNSVGAEMWIAAVVMGLFSMGTPAVIVAAYPHILGKPELLTVGMGVLLLVQSLGQFFGSFVPSMLLGPNLSGWFVCGIAMLVLGLAGTLLVALCRFK